MDEDKDLIKIKTDALRLLSFRPRSVEELRKRLKLKRYPDDLIGKTIDSLKTQGLLDDEKFAKLFANSRVYSRPSGKRSLEIELKQKGLSSELVKKTLGELQDYDEKKIARELVLGKFSKMTGISQEKKKARLYGFLKRRGFENSTIFAVLNELFKEIEEF